MDETVARNAPPKSSRNSGVPAVEETVGKLSRQLRDGIPLNSVDQRRFRSPAGASPLPPPWQFRKVGLDAGGRLASNQEKTWSPTSSRRHGRRSEDWQIPRCGKDGQLLLGLRAQWVGWHRREKTRCLFGRKPPRRTAVVSIHRPILLA